MLKLNRKALKETHGIPVSAKNVTISEDGLRTYQITTLDSHSFLFGACESVPNHWLAHFSNGQPFEMQGNLYDVVCFLRSVNGERNTPGSIQKIEEIQHFMTDSDQEYIFSEADLPCISQAPENQKIQILGKLFRVEYTSGGSDLMSVTKLEEESKPFKGGKVTNIHVTYADSMDELFYENSSIFRGMRSTIKTYQEVDLFWNSEKKEIQEVLSEIS